MSVFFKYLASTFVIFLLAASASIKAESQGFMEGHLKIIFMQSGGVAYLAHIGGFIFGVATARLFEDPRRIAWQQGTD